MLTRHQLYFHFTVSLYSNMSNPDSESDSDFKECNMDEEPSTRLSSSCDVNCGPPSFQEEPTTTEAPPKSKSLKDIMVIA